MAFTDPDLAEYPFIYLVEGGRMRLTDEEVVALRAYLDGGGFLMLDDFWGEAEWVMLTSQLARVFPDRMPEPLWAEHEIFWSFYPIAQMPAVPGYAELTIAGRELTWQTDSGVVRTLGANPDSASPDRSAAYWGISDDSGRLMAILLHNMDFGDAWEHIDDPNYPIEASRGGAVPMGINIVAYALTH